MKRGCAALGRSAFRVEHKFFKIDPTLLVLRPYALSHAHCGVTLAPKAVCVVSVSYFGERVEAK